MMAKNEKNMNVFYDFSRDDFAVLTIVEHSRPSALLAEVFAILLDNYDQINLYEMDLGKLEKILRGE